MNRQIPFNKIPQIILNFTDTTINKPLQMILLIITKTTHIVTHINRNVLVRY